MKKSIFPLIFFLSVILSACEEKIVDLVVNIDDIFQYSVSNEGEFDESYTVNKDDLIDDDLELYSITDVNIESLALQIIPAAGNEASRISLSTLYIDENFPGGIYINEDLLIDISNYNTLKPLTGYNYTGINALADKIQAYINGSDLSSFKVNIFGTSVDNTGKPTTEDIVLDILIELNASAVFSERVELPDL